jgi:hypothetical protein
MSTKKIFAEANKDNTTIVVDTGQLVSSQATVIAPDANGNWGYVIPSTGVVNTRG